MSQYDVNVHDITIKDAQIFGTGNKVTQVRRVTFYVGDHGPFTRDFPVNDGTTTAIKSYIDGQVSQISELVKYGQ